MDKREYQREYRRKRKEAGICYQCKNPVYRGRVRCVKHLRMDCADSRKYQKKIGEEYLKRQRNNKQRRKEEGKCATCSTPLESYERVTCSNCSERIKKERCRNANFIV